MSAGPDSETGPGVRVTSVRPAAFSIPTDQPEADGTIAWDSTTMVTVGVEAGDQVGLGWTYGATAAAKVIEEKLAGVVQGQDPLDVPGLNEAMARAVRNLGRPGIAACAISAVDTALWDLKAKLVGLPLVRLFGRAHDSVPLYGSGGFTTYDDQTTAAQVERWVGEWGMTRVKIKIGESWGSRPGRDRHRVELVRRLIGDDVELFVDANGGYQRKQAIRLGREMAERHGVTWFEEPVSSDDLVGLREVRDNCPADVAAGEYGYDLSYFSTMVEAEAVDCLQVDVTRCGGYTDWLRAAAVAGAHSLGVSGHCAPNLHAQVAVAAPNLVHLEYFHDHHRIENMLFDGALSPMGGRLTPRLDVNGHGMTLKEPDAERYRVA
jgi:L-alanine-DL-glutamate epimerase-like enolase superfamily enzyme